MCPGLAPGTNVTVSDVTPSEHSSFSAQQARDTSNHIVGADGADFTSIVVAVVLPPRSYLAMMIRV